MATTAKVTIASGAPLCSSARPKTRGATASASRLPAFLRGSVRTLSGERVLGATTKRAPTGRRGAVVGVSASADYVPSPMDSSLLLPQLAVLGFVGVAGAYWWFVLVPSARVRLAVNKRSGKLREYLEELKQDDSRPMERWFYSNWLEKVDPETKYLLRDDKAAGGEGGSARAATAVKLEDTGGVETGRDADDSLEEVIRKARKTPKFWSGDNPVLVGTVLSVLGAAAAASVSALLGAADGTL